jgi:hypothetical protein
LPVHSDNEDEDNGSVNEGEEGKDGEEEYEEEDHNVNEGQQQMEEVGLGGLVEMAWLNRKPKLENDYSIAAWALSVMPEVYDDCTSRLTGDKRNAIERVVRKLFKEPFTNNIPSVQGMSEEEIVDTFWDEFKAFRNKTAPFDKEHRWNAIGARQGKSHLWHEKYSMPHTKVVGHVGCKVTSPLTGIGPCERVWGGVKGIKCGTRALMSGEKTEKRSIVYTSAIISEARHQRDSKERLEGNTVNTIFGDDDMK